MGVLEMDSRPFPAPLPHGNPVPFPPPPDSRLRTSDMILTFMRSKKYHAIQCRYDSLLLDQPEYCSSSSAGNLPNFLDFEVDIK